MDTSTIIDARSLNVWYGGVHAVKNVSMQVPRNQITALIGASGSGKSTFLRCVNRMLDHVPVVRIEGEIHVGDKGNILADPTDVVHLRRTVGMVFQNPAPFPKSIFDNVAYGLELHGVRGRRRWSLRKRTYDSAVLERSDDPLEAGVVRSLKEAALWEEVKDRLHHSAYRLSGGQQQRLCIARSIAPRPEVILLDEPCSDLDPISTRYIEELLLRLKKDYTIMIVTHNMHQARRVADRVAFFHSGELMEYDETARIFGDAKQMLTRSYVEGAFG